MVRLYLSATYPLKFFPIILSYLLILPGKIHIRAGGMFQLNGIFGLTPPKRNCKEFGALLSQTGELFISEQRNFKNHAVGDYMSLRQVGTSYACLKRKKKTE